MLRNRIPPQTPNPDSGAETSAGPALEIESIKCSASEAAGFVSFEVSLSGERTGSVELQQSILGRMVGNVEYPTSLRFKVESSDGTTVLADGLVSIPGPIEIGQRFKATGGAFFSGALNSGNTVGRVTLIEPDGCGPDCVAGPTSAACRWKAIY